MNIFLRQLRRTKVRSCLLTAMLALAAGFLCIGFSAWYSARAAINSMDAQYTTIAMRDASLETQVWSDWRAAYAALRQETGGQGETFSQERKSLQQRRIETLDALEARWADSEAYLEQDGLVQFADRRGLLAAHVPGCMALTSASLDYLDYVAEADLSQNLCAAAVRCTDYAREDEDCGAVDGSGESYIRQTYRTHFAVEEYLFLPDGYEHTKPEVLIEQGIFNVFLPDGGDPFEVGQTYLIWGRYEGPEILEKTALKKEKTEDGAWIVTEMGRGAEWGSPGLLALGPAENNFGEVFKNANGAAYYYMPEDAMPVFTPYTGSVEKFLASEEGRVWREEILPFCRRSQETVTAVLTDRLESIYAFNTGSAWITQGRTVSREEYAQGAAVCVVSEAYAQFNGLSVGDSLELEFYDVPWREMDAITCITFHHDPIFEQYATGLRQRYTIVGLYAARAFPLDTYAFDINTVYVPLGSVPEGQAYHHPEFLRMTSYIVQNGQAGALEQGLAAQGLGGLYLYFDQGYGAAKETWEGLKNSALRLLCVSAAVFLLAAAVFLALNLRRMLPAVRTARSLGAKREALWRELWTALLPMAILSGVLGGLLGCALFQLVCRKLFSEHIVLRPGAVMLCAGLQVLLLLLASGVWTRGAVPRSLMRQKRTRKGR